MNLEIIGILVLVIAVIVGPFAALRAVSFYRARRGAAPKSPGQKDDKPDDSSGFW